MRLFGPVGDGIVVRSEWAERVEAMDEMFAALAESRERRARAIALLERGLP